MQGGEWHGEWWLPHLAARRVLGTLTLDGDDFALVTDERLELPPAPALNEVPRELWSRRRHPVVLGALDSGEAVTLIRCDGLAAIAPFDRARETWRPAAAILGAELANPDDEIFDEIELELEHLSSFAGDPGVAVEIVQRQDGRVEKASFSAERRVLQHASLPGAEVELVAEPRPVVGQARCEVAVRVVLAIHLSHAISWHDAWSKWAVAMRDLVCVLTGRACAVDAVVLRQRGRDDKARNVGTLVVRTEDVRRRRAKPLWTDDFVLDASTLPGGFEVAVRRWSEFWTRHRVAMREITAVWHAPFSYVDDIFLAYTRAIGPLLSSSARSASERLADVEQQRWLQDVSEALPEHLRDGVMAQLNPAGANARHELRSFIEDVEPIGSWLTGGDPDSFAASVIATRGHYVHPSRTPPKRVLKDDDFVVYTRALGWLLRSTVMLRLGISAEELASRLKAMPASSVAEAMFERTDRTR